MSLLRFSRTKAAWLIAAIVTTLVGVTLSIIGGTSAFAATSNVTFTGSTQTGGATATWTIGFTTTNGNSGDLAATDTITVKFASSFGKTSPANVTLLTGFSSCSATATTSGDTFIIVLANSGGTCAHAKSTAASLAIAGITNAPVGTYQANNFSVATSKDAAAGSPTANVTLTVGAAARLAYTTAPPATGTAGSALSTFRVSVQDVGGNTITTGSGSADTITLSIATGPAGGAFNSPAPSYTDVAAAAGVATFSGVVLNTAGSYTLTASDTTVGHTGFTTATSSAIVVSAAAGSKLAFVQGPSSGSAGVAISPAITVQAQDSNGNAVATSGVTVTLSVSAGVIDSGATATTNSAGRATFSGVTINTAATGLTMTASATGLTATAASAQFNITVAVSNGAALTDTANDGAGSGVKTVAYFYCPGSTGSCTSANWTPIGSSTSSAGNYLVTWSGQPANGPYRLVVVGTDNVTNASQPSSSIPVTVTN